MKKTYSVWYRPTKGDVATKLVTKAEDIQTALDHVMDTYPTCEVIFLSEDNLEII